MRRDIQSFHALYCSTFLLHHNDTRERQNKLATLLACPGALWYHFLSLGHPEEIYSNPQTVFAAPFVGTSNQFKGTVESAAEGLCKAGNYTLHVLPQPALRNGNSVLVIVRPEEVTLQQESTDASANGVGNHIAGVIELRTFLGPFTRFHVNINGDAILTADIPSQQARNYETGQKVLLSFPPTACQVLPLDTRSVVMEQLAEEV